MPQRTSHPAGSPSWYDLMTSDLNAVKPFYAALFGWSLEDQGENYGHYHMARIGGQDVAGMGGLPAGAPMPSAWTVYFASDDLNADAQRLKDLGGQVMVEPMTVGDRGHMLIAADPTGAAFGLWQKITFGGSGLENEHGSMSWQECYTRDSAKARDFYMPLLGAEAEPMEGMDYFVLNKAGVGSMAGIMGMDAQHFPAEIPAHWLPYFAVSDIQAATKTVTEQGGVVRVPPFDSPYGQISVVADPAGAGFALIQLTQP